MKAFEIKTNKSDYPFLVIAESFKEAVEILNNKGIYDRNILSVCQLEAYNSSHILIEERLKAKAELEDEVRYEFQKNMPRWEKMIDGAAVGGCYDVYLIRTSKGHYFTSNCIGGGGGHYLKLISLEQLPGIGKEPAE